MRIIVLLILLFGCGTDESEKTYDFDKFLLKVSVVPYDDLDEEMIMVQIVSESDRYPLPLGEGVARTEDKALAFALKEMSDKILKEMEMIKGRTYHPLQD